MNKKVLKKLLFAIILVLTFPVNALELVFTLTPEAVFPFTKAGSEKYAKVGFGGMLDTGVTLFDFVNVGTTAGFYSVPKQSADKLKDEEAKNVMFVPFGIKAGAIYYPLSRLSVYGGFATGVSIAFSGNIPHYQPWYKAEAVAAFRINPQLSLGLSVSWLDFQFNTYFKNPLLNSLTAGISITYRYDTRKTSGSVSAVTEYDDNVFPLLYTIYKDNSFGTITVSNDETAEIKNVRISIRAENYMASELECGYIPILHKYNSESVPLIADFSEAILGFSENGQIPAEVVINYELLGQKRTAVSQIIIPVYNRNQMRWADPSVVASYISTTSQEVQEFSKYLVGFARRYLRTGLNRNMQFAMYVFEGMRLSGIKYDENSTTPYDTYHRDPAILDYIQYPYQTMIYKSGDKDDLGILLMSLLEAVGIETTFIATDNDFLVLFNTEIDQDNAGNYFYDKDKVIVLEDGNVWIPLSMKVLNEGFINSWYKGAEEINLVNETEQEYYLVNIAQAWNSYPPAGFTSGENVSLSTSEKTVNETVETNLSRYITAEFGPQIAAIQNRIKKEGATTSLYNQLGMLYVRAGMFSNAIPVFQLSAKMGSVQAMNNLGNIASLQKKYTDAVYWYKKALEQDPQNATARSNLSRIQSELEN